MKNEIIEDKNNFSYLYEMLFSIVSNIISDKTKSEIKLKQFNILEKIISNIISAEKSNKNSEKFRKIRINNPNIDLVLKIKGVYDFFIFLGFKQESFEDDGKNETYLYLPEENLSLQKLEKSLFYMNLLNLNFIDFNDEENLNNYETPEYQENLKQKRLNNEIMPEMNIIEMNDDINDDMNDGRKILEETGLERLTRALKYSENNNSSFFSIKSVLDFITCNICGKEEKEETKKFFEQKEKQDDNKKKIMTLSDLDYKNPSRSNELENKDEIGKACLKLTNDFRAKYKLPPLEWDNSIWSIAYTHSKNMGEGIVPFGHKGFNERVNKFNFSCSKACENVYMCQGYSQYDIAENAVKGWINSPGHRKNLLSNTTHCAIATYKTSSGAFYLTQMFARK